VDGDDDAAFQPVGDTASGDTGPGAA